MDILIDMLVQALPLRLVPVLLGYLLPRAGADQPLLSSVIPGKINSGHAAIELGISWQPSIAPQANPGSIKNKPAIYLIEPNSPRVRSMCLSVSLCVCHTEKRYSDLTVVPLAGKDTTQRPPQSKLKIPI